jgi:nitrite reductase (NADH) small subunit
MSPPATAAAAALGAPPPAALGAPAALWRVCDVDDVPIGEGRAVTMGDGRRIAVFHTPTGWYALDGACPHSGGPLADGLLADRCVTCPLHDRRFDLATGAALGGGEPAVAHRVLVRGEQVLVEL